MNASKENSIGYIPTWWPFRGLYYILMVSLYILHLYLSLFYFGTQLQFKLQESSNLGKLQSHCTSTMLTWCQGLWDETRKELETEKLNSSGLPHCCACWLVMSGLLALMVMWEINTLRSIRIPMSWWSHLVSTIVLTQGFSCSFSTLNNLPIWWQAEN